MAADVGGEANMARRRKKNRRASEHAQAGQVPTHKRVPERLGTALSPLLKAMLKEEAERREQEKRREHEQATAQAAVQERERTAAQAKAVAAAAERSRAEAAARKRFSASASSEQLAAEAPDAIQPLSPPTARDLRLLNEAYDGVVPLAQSQRRAMRRALSRRPLRAPLPESSQPSAEQQARARLNSLVGEGTRFDINVDADGWAEAIRHGVSRRELRRLRSPAFHAEASLDLHGQTVAQVDAAVNTFVRGHHRKGCRYLLIVHGKGLHSAAQCGVLGEAVLQSLTRGGAAPLVRALAHAHERRGGRGALAIALM